MFKCYVVDEKSQTIFDAKVPTDFQLGQHTLYIYKNQKKSQITREIVDSEKKAFEEEMQLQQRGRPVIRDDYYEKRESSEERPIRSTTPKAVEHPETQDNDDDIDYWCYYCASPLKNVPSDMRKTIQQFLKVRRTTYPYDVATKLCNNARNASSWAKQKCRHPYCETLSIVDHNEGAAFVLRGCAENFGAIDTKTLEQQEGNQCTNHSKIKMLIFCRLHDLLDIQECICKTPRYCYAGQSRRRSVAWSPNPAAIVFTLISLLALFLIISDF
ncbi:unnamed protein product [Cylicocyclus nassatus]|uniref:Uncharacterized protein n=1 Tax=Cylicocyclus nassatus TaxID=53992 RepID=A0AA36MHH7_CYLNA|nr:unnamed protein product [Cylicocyclus nassatus]